MSRTGTASGSTWMGCRWPGHVGAVLHRAGDGRLVRVGYGFDQVAQASILADGHDDANSRLVAEGDDDVGVKVAVGPNVSGAVAPASWTRPTVFRRKWTAP